MAQITFVLRDGSEKTLEVANGNNLMMAALSQGVDGIVGECGGSAMCATCHVYVERGPVDAVPPVSSVEEAMLEFTASERLPSSRLGCQLLVSDDMDGLVVRMPEQQVW